MRNVHIGALAAICFSLIGAPIDARARQLQKFTSVGSGHVLQYAAFYIAVQAKLFEQEGLTADQVSVDSGPKVSAALEGGSAQVGLLGCYETATAASRGGAAVVIAHLYDTFPLFVVLGKDVAARVGVTPTSTVDQKVKMLRGLKIGITSPGSATDLMIRSLFLARGMNPDSDILLQPVGVDAAQIAALEKKLTDGFVFGAPAPQIAVSRGLGQIVINPFEDEIPEMHGLVNTCLAASREVIQKQPKLVLGVLRAVARSIKLMRESPDDARKFTRAEFKEVDEAVFNQSYDTTFKGYPKSLVLTPEELKATVAWRNIGSTKPVEVQYDAAVSPTLARQAEVEILGR